MGVTTIAASIFVLTLLGGIPASPEELLEAVLEWSDYNRIGRYKQ